MSKRLVIRQELNQSASSHTLNGIPNACNKFSSFKVLYM